MGLGILFLASCLGLGLAVVVYVIAADRTRFLTRFDLPQWREGYYLRSLPNFLQALHDHHFTTAWPVHCNAVSAAFFRFRVRPLLQRKPRKLRRAFLQQHIILFGLREALRPYIQDFLLHQQQRIVGSRIVEMEDTLDREKLMEYLQNIGALRAAHQASLNNYDRHIMVEMAETQFMSTLRRAHAIFQEHGYTLLPELTQLRDWQEMTGVELVQELPHVPIAKRLRRLKVGT